MPESMSLRLIVWVNIHRSSFSCLVEASIVLKHGLRIDERSNISNLTEMITYQEESGSRITMDLIELLTDFTIRPAVVRQRCRVELNISDEIAADVYVLIIFLCDDLLQLKANNDKMDKMDKMDKTVRFFDIASRLPIELQMTLCHRAVTSAKTTFFGHVWNGLLRSSSNTLLWTVVSCIVHNTMLWNLHLLLPSN